MRTEFLPFSRPSISETDIQAVVDVLRSGWITTGPRAADLEDRIKELVGCRHAVAVSSATAGMHVVLCSLDLAPGDEVITPSLTWVSTVNLITLLGARPVFVDVDRHTLMPSAETFAGAVTPRTRAVIPVHYAGAAADVGPLREILAPRGITLVEDAAHALGTTYRGEAIGHRGTSIFSFHPIKNITTGEGGMVCTDDDGMAEKVRRLKFHGLGVDAYDRRVQGRSPQAEVLEPGFKYNLPDILAALGLSQLARLSEINRKRSALAMQYREKLSSITGILPLVDPDYPMEHAWHLFIVRIEPERAGMDRSRFMELLKERNIGTGIHFRAVHSQSYYARAMQIPPGSLPETEWNSDRILSLPLFPDMAESDVDDVVDSIRSILDR